jgi:ketosteroid isomerase-like protein
LILENKGSPEKFFPAFDRGTLRSLWGADEDAWIELPGPAEWWPDDPSWYATHGFEPRLDQFENYRKALRALDAETPPPDWEQHLLPKNARYDLTWNQYFGVYGI